MIISGANTAGFQLASLPGAPQAQSSSYSWQRDTFQGGTTGQNSDYPAKLARCQWLDQKLGEIDTFWKTCDGEIHGWGQEISSLQSEISRLGTEESGATWKLKDLTWKLSSARDKHHDAKREQHELASRSEEEKANDSYHQWKFNDANNKRTTAANEAYQLEQEIAALTARQAAIGYEVSGKHNQIADLQRRIASRQNDKQYYTYDMQAMREELRTAAYELSYHPSNPLS